MTNANEKNSVLNIPAFWKAQKKDWQITVIRTSMERFGFKLLLPYLTLYIILQGATTTQVGYITSMGLILGGLLVPYLGQINDRKGPKKTYIVGVCILMVAYASFAFAKVWQVALLGMFLRSLGDTISMSSCATICGNCLNNCDRAKGMTICESLVAGLLGVVGPVIGGWILVKLMHVDATPTDPNAIRPLFVIALAVTIASLILLVTQLSNVRWTTANPAKRRSIIKDAVSLFQLDKNCLRWVFASMVASTPMAYLTQYVQFFAAEAKSASSETLAAMATVTSLVALTCGYLGGSLSDKIGRKKVLFITEGLYVIGLILLISANNAVMLIIVGVLQGFQEVGAPVNAAMQNELVPHKVIGRWNGIVRFFNSMFAALIAAVGGIIYDRFGGQWLFIVYIAFELLLRFPILLKLPETLHYKIDEQRFAPLDE